MTLKDKKLIPFCNLPGMVLDYAPNQVGVVLGYNPHGLIVEDVPELDNLAQGENCPNCRAVQHLKNSYAKADMPPNQQPLNAPIISQMKIVLYSTLQGQSVVEIVNPSLSIEEAICVGRYLKALNNELMVSTPVI